MTAGLNPTSVLVSAWVDGGSVAVLLRDGVKALGLHLNSQQMDQVLQHLALLHKWNRVHNLTAIHSPEDAARLHALDCLAALTKWVSRETPPGQVLDVGSGAGFPAVLMAILWPGTQVLAIDAVAKKAAFIQQVAAQLGLTNLKARHVRAQDLSGRYDVITCRAFASLSDVVVWTEHLLRPGGSWVCLKGKTPDEEVAELPATVSVSAIDPVSVPGLDAERCLVWMNAI
jgi:16S rRNA (guanine527-N7)-methyltransferase